MLTPNKQSARTKALLAVAFASGVMTLQPPALSESESESPESIPKQIVNNAVIPPDAKAFFLLSIADSYLRGDTKSTVAQRFGHENNANPTPWIVGFAGGLNLLENMTNELALSGGLKRRYERIGEGGESQALSDENRLLAKKALQMSVPQIDLSSDPRAKLNMYFVASKLLDATGDHSLSTQCDRALQNTFLSCEKYQSEDDQQIEAVASLLNLMAYGLAPLSIPDLKPPAQGHPFVGKQKAEAKDFNQADSDKSEMLRLRAIAILDRLTPSNHSRRKAHRDMVFWYIHRGKPELAERQKKILFKLVDSEDENVLYAKSGGCGHLVWWHKNNGQLFGGGCGMG